MKNKELRKWMRQYVFSKLNRDSELAKRDLITVKDNKITDMAYGLLLNLKHYVTTHAKHKAFVDTGNMALDEFKKEFIDSDEDFKTTVLYGYIARKDVFQGYNEKDKDGFVLGFKRGGGFKLQTKYMEDVVHEDISEWTEDLDDFIQAEIEKEDERVKFARSLTSVKEFTAAATRKGRGIPKRRSTGLPSVQHTRTGATQHPSKSLKWMWWATKKEMEAEFAKLDEKVKEAMIDKIQQVAGGYGIRLTSIEHIQGEYDLLNSKLKAEQAASKEKGHVTEGLNLAVEKMRAFKGGIDQILRVHSESAIKDYLGRIKKYESENKKSARGLITEGVIRNQQFFNERRSAIAKIYWGDRLSERGLVVDKKGNVYHPIDPQTYLEAFKGKYAHGQGKVVEYKVMNKEKGIEEKRIGVEYTVLNEKTGLQETKIKPLNKIPYFEWSKKDNRTIKKIYKAHFRKREKLKTYLKRTPDAANKSVVYKGDFKYASYKVLKERIRFLKKHETDKDLMKRAKRNMQERKRQQGLIGKPLSNPTIEALRAEIRNVKAAIRLGQTETGSLDALRTNLDKERKRYRKELRAIARTKRTAISNAKKAEAARLRENRKVVKSYNTWLRRTVKRNKKNKKLRNAFKTK